MSKEKLLKLKAPTQSNEIEWRAQPNKANTKKQYIPYIDNRAVMNRLDDAFGQEGWKVSFTEYKGGAKCSLSIKIDDEWITKEDVGEDTQIAPIKGGVSNAMKRASHQWGIGRDLYDYPYLYGDIVGKYDGYKVDKVAKKQLTQIATQISSGKEVQPFIQINGNKPF